MNRIWTLMGISIAILFLVACNLAEGADPSSEVTRSMEEFPVTPYNNLETPVPSLTITPTSLDPNDMDLRKITSIPERITPDPSGSDPIIGEVPEDILQKILSDLAQKIGVEQQTIRLIRSEAVIWNDGSLGCPKPGELYTQALVNGYWVVLEAGDEEFDYRASETGYYFMCEKAFPHIPPQSTPDS